MSQFVEDQALLAELRGEPTDRQRIEVLEKRLGELSDVVFNRRRQPPFPSLGGLGATRPQGCIQQLGCPAQAIGGGLAWVCTLPNCPHTAKPQRAWPQNDWQRAT